MPKERKVKKKPLHKSVRAILFYLLSSKYYVLKKKFCAARAGICCIKKANFFSQYFSNVDFKIFILSF